MGMLSPKAAKQRQDLSQRQRVPAPPQPTFSPRAYKVGSAEVAENDIVDLFVPNAAVTVQWLQVSISAAASIQLLEDGDPVGLLLSPSGAAVVKYPGRFLPNNVKLSLDVTGNCDVNWEVAYVKEFVSGLISLESSVTLL
jgi:hypothetical protein